MFFRSTILKFQCACGVWDLSWRFWVSGVRQSAFLRGFHGKSDPVCEWNVTSLVAQMAKRLPTMWETGFDLWVGKISWRRKWQPTPVLLPGKSRERRSLVGCSPWGRWGSDTTERLHFHFSLSCTGEGNGNPLQCSCLENPRDGRAWWTAVCGVTQSRTRLKWLSCSSSHRRLKSLWMTCMPGDPWNVTMSPFWTPPICKTVC